MSQSVIWHQANLFSGVIIKPRSGMSSHATLPECNKWFITH